MTAAARALASAAIAAVCVFAALATLLGACTDALAGNLPEAALGTVGALGWLAMARSARRRWQSALAPVPTERERLP